MQRRNFLSLMGTSLLWPVAARSVAAQPAEYPLVKPRTLVFPRDHGAHPTYRTEWWYITGWLNDARGFQLTFFRNRPGIAEDSASAFAPKQLLFAHAAISDPRRGRLLHDQRTARAGFDLAGALEDDTRVWIDDWRLERTDAGYRTHIAAADFAFDFEFRTAHER